MPINVSEALDSDTSETITVERKTAGGYVDGLYVPGSTSQFKALASVQQPTPNDLQTLPEGERNKNPRVFYCNKPLRTTSDKDSTIADIVIFKGVKFKIIMLGDWNSFGHNIGFGVREQ